MEQFSYASAPLSAEEIRLFSILPSSNPELPERLDIELTKAAINDLPDFYAISYLWGRPNSSSQDPQNIFVDNKFLSVTRSIQEVLLALRTPEKLWFWADQICINQKDDKEKDLQLPYMATIYGKSTRTIAWLGAETRNSAAAMAFLSKLACKGSKLGITHVDHEQLRKLFTDEDDDFGTVNAMDTDSATRRTEVHSFVSEMGNILHLSDLDAVLEFCALPYFTRGWVREEIALPKNLLLRWGNQFIDGDTLADAIHLLKLYVHHSIGRLRKSPIDSETAITIQLIEDRTSPLYDSIQPTAVARRQYQMNPAVRFFNMAYILRNYRHLEFTNPRDRVHGVLGLANDWRDLGIPIRSSKSVPDEVVLTQTAKKIIQKRVEDDDNWGGINFMLLCGDFPPMTAESKSNRLPSWVPRLERQDPFTLSDETTFVSSHPFNASRGFRHPITKEEQDDADPNIFLCSIMVVDSVKNTGKPEADLRDALVAIWNFAGESDVIVKSDPESKHPYCKPTAQEKLLTARWRVPILDHEFLSNPTSLRRATTLSREGFCALWGMKGADAIQNSKIKAENYEESCHPLRSRVPFLGEKGFVGIGPRNVQKGDLVCVILGGRFPFILRRRSAPELARYELVGEAYCDGIMDGEAFHMGIATRTVELI